MHRTCRRLAAVFLTATALTATLGAPVAQAYPAPSSPPAATALPLGPTDLTETRSQEQLAPGATLTTIVRGHTDPTGEFWTIGINIPVGEVGPDPDPDAPQAALGSRNKVEAVDAQLQAAPRVAAAMADQGVAPRIEPVDWAPQMPGYDGGLIGYTLRIGRYTTAPTRADPLLAALSAEHFKAFPVYTGQDGRPDNTGPWVVRVLTLDPREFRGRVSSTVGDWVSGQETTSAMARKAGALYAINGGFFTISPSDGTPGVPAGLSVVDGTVQTAATNSRVALVLGNGGRRTRITRLTSRYTIRFGAATHLLDGLNRPPGLIRNCGGVGGDAPTLRPVQDFTCTDPDEMVALTPRYGATPPAGPGVEALVGADGVVAEVRPRTGAAVPAGDTLVQAIGTDATWLSGHVHAGTPMHLGTTVQDADGAPVHFGPSESVVNGGPQLVAGGQIAVDAVAEGMVHEDPALGLPASALGAAWAYSWVVRDNPRTGVGVDANGRLLFVQVDGRQAELSQGLSILAFAQVMRALGAVDAINLDGGGSSATVINGNLVSSPSDVDASGNHVERKDGDAIVVVPDH